MVKDEKYIQRFQEYGKKWNVEFDILRKTYLMSWKNSYAECMALTVHQ